MDVEPDTFKPAVIIPAYSRPGALRRLLQSVQNAHFPHDIDLIISLDGGANPAVRACAQDFTFRSGSIEIVEREENLGLREHILWCGDQSERYGSVIILEDDLLADPWFYYYAVHALSAHRVMSDIAGIALYAPHFNEYAQLPFEPLCNGLSAYWMQVPCSWGQAWHAQQWREFRDWYHQVDDALVNADPAIPARVRSWPSSSWKKYFAAYLTATNKYFVYPYRSLTTNCNDAGGTHERLSSDIHQVALQDPTRDFVEPTFPARLQDAVTYDAFMEAQLNVDLEVLSITQGSLAVDLYASKPRELLAAYDYCLTTRPVRSALRYFPLCFRPLEMNIITGDGGLTEGPIQLCRVNQLCDSESHFARARSLYRLKWYFLAGSKSGLSLLLFGLVTLFKRIFNR